MPVVLEEGAWESLRDVAGFSRLWLPGWLLRRYQVGPARVNVESVEGGLGRQFAVVFSRPAGKDELLAQWLAFLLVRYRQRGAEDHGRRCRRRQLPAGHPRRPERHRAELIASRSKAVPRHFSDSFFNGNSAATPKAFEGITREIPDAQTVAAGANGGALTLALMDGLIDLVKPGRPDALLLSKRSRRTPSALRRASGNLLETEVDAFGQRASSTTASRSLSTSSSPTPRRRGPAARSAPRSTPSSSARGSASWGWSTAASRSRSSASWRRRTPPTTGSSGRGHKWKIEGGRDDVARVVVGAVDSCREAERV